MKEIEIKYNGLKVKHLQYVAQIDEETTLKSKVEIMANVLNVKKEELYRIDNESFNMLYSLILNDLNKIVEKKDVKQKITVNGKEYKFIDPRKQQMAWYIDASLLKLNPETIMALCYIPVEAKCYYELDENNNPKYDILQREAEMLNADLADFFSLNAFFLRQWRKMEKKLLKLVAIEKMRRKKLSYLLMNGLMC